MEELNQIRKKAIIFVGTKLGADILCQQIQTAGYKVGVLHGEKTQQHRDFTLRAFKHGDVNFLVATDVAARGIGE